MMEYLSNPYPEDERNEAITSKETAVTHIRQRDVQSFCVLDNVHVLVCAQV